MINIFFYQKHNFVSEKFQPPKIAQKWLCFQEGEKINESASGFLKYEAKHQYSF